MRLALDTNVLVYAEGANGADRQAAALETLAGLEADEIILPAQALGELFAVLTRKAAWPAARARDAVLGWIDAYPVMDTTPAVLLEAMELVRAHRMSFWDSIMLAAAAQTECRLLLSEDMQNGFIWRGVEIRNSFAAA